MSTRTDLLDVLRCASARGDDLASALDLSGLPGSAEAAAALREGKNLAVALAGLLPPRLAEALAAPAPPLPVLAALALSEAQRDDARRRMLAEQLSYPLASLFLVGLLALVVHLLLPPAPGYGRAFALGWLALPASVTMVLAAAPFLPRHWRLPGSGWCRHLDAAGRWARAGLVREWRLTEAEAHRLLNLDCAPYQAALAAPEATTHCRTLAVWHRHRAELRLFLTARLAAAAILACGGALVLASLRIWTGGDI